MKPDKTSILDNVTNDVLLFGFSILRRNGNVIETVPMEEVYEFLAGIDKAGFKSKMESAIALCKKLNSK